MMSERDDLSRFRHAYLDYLEGTLGEPPALEELPEDQRPAAESFIASITATRGIDPYASRPSIEQLLAWRSQANDKTGELREVLEDHLRNTVDHKAVVTIDPASAAMELASALEIQARGMRIRVVPETTSENLEYALTGKAEDIARVFSAFPETHAVLYTTTGQNPLAVVVDRGDVQGAIETPSGEMRAPRLRRPVADPGTACEVWLKGPDSRVPASGHRPPRIRGRSRVGPGSSQPSEKGGRRSVHRRGPSQDTGQTGHLERLWRPGGGTTSRNCQGGSTWTTVRGGL